MVDESYNLLEDVTQLQLINVKNLDLNTKEGRDALDKATKMVELLILVDKDDADVHDKAERRRIEEEKNKAMIKVEHEKQLITWRRAGLEMAKVVVPAVISMIGYNVFQKRVLRFEETGRVTSTAGRELHLPRFMK